VIPSDQSERPERPDETYLNTTTSTLTSPIKLVIWDLDDTLWTGTLSEGPVTLNHEGANVIRQLNRRGIVNSICSKNDADGARERLMAEDGIWDEFVFPRIGWFSKGAEIAQLIEDMQLRTENVLFIDDNIGNLQEAQFYSAGIQTAEPIIITHLLDLPQLAGKNDSTLSRLNQYRLLEQKQEDRRSNDGSNEAFLRSCEIRVQLGVDCVDEIDRIAELVDRTNQLNYTKRRLTPDELLTMFADSERESRFVRVVDRYGDYGICGFYSIHQGRLSDFLFSCRILHMGVEQWLYAHLGSPAIDIVGDVVSPVHSDRPVDWIALVGDSDVDRSAASGQAKTAQAPRRILIKGGCDLQVICDYLGGSLDTEFSYVGSWGALVHSEHTEILRRSTSDSAATNGAVIDRMPFVDRRAYSSKIFTSTDYRVLVYSVLMDYTQGLYRLRGTDFIVPYGDFAQDITSREHWDSLEARFGSIGFDRPFLEWFADQFEFQGGLDPTNFVDNIRWLAAELPSHAELVLFNGSEVALPHDADRHLHHRTMNSALQDVVATIPNATVCDVRLFVTSADDVTDNLRHYRRGTYLKMAESLSELVEGDLQAHPESYAHRAARLGLTMGSKIRRRVRPILPRSAGS
jgi:FkbH-like protein